MNVEHRITNVDWSREWRVVSGEHGRITNNDLTLSEIRVPDNASLFVHFV